MSPKSRGRPPARGGARPRQDRQLRTPTMADRVLADAGELARGGLLDAEIWASAHLGWAWASAPQHDPAPELRLVRAVADRARARPALPQAAAVGALARLLDPATPGLDEALAGLPPAPWPGPTAWTPVRARRAVDLFGSACVLLVRFDGPEPHVLMAAIDQGAGRWVAGLEMLQPDAIDTDVRQDGDPMGPAVDHPVADALAELAGALRDGDASWPRPEMPEYLELRALAWSRCRGYLREPVPYEPMPEAERAALVTAFVTSAAVGDSKVTRSLAGRFVDFGDAWLPDGPLSWSPEAVEAFFADELARGHPLDDDEMDDLPDVLEEFVRFALTRRGVPEKWVEEAVEAVGQAAEEFGPGIDPEAAREIFGALVERDVDVTDEAAVERALREILDERDGPPPPPLL